MIGTGSPTETLAAVPPFDPHPWMRGGHAQTILARYLPSRPVALGGRHEVIPLPDGDALSAWDSRPTGWTAGDPVALLVHGLAGTADAPYLARVAQRLFDRGIRVVRMNLRGAGSGFGLARKTYHVGLTEDVRAVAEQAMSEAAGSPLALIGFSLGGNLVLKLAAEAADVPLSGLDCVLAANPPADPEACCRYIRRPSSRVYDRHFARLLRADVARLHARFPDLGPADLRGVDGLYAFDDAYTAPRHGFADARDYYARSGAGPLLARIEVPGLVVHAEDDPFIDPETIRGADFPDGIALELTRHGGHLGYISRSPWQGDRRWLDARLAAYLTARWGRDRTRTGRSHETLR